MSDDEKGTVWDFSWDECQLQGLWVGDELETATLVEASAMVWDTDHGWMPCGEYYLASQITLRPGDGLCIDGTEAPVFGFAANRALGRLKRLEATEPVCRTEDD